MGYDLKKFKNGLEKLNLTLCDDQINQFLIYYEMLIEKNKVMNLTAITEFDEVIEKHFLDSLSLVKVFKAEEDTALEKERGLEEYILNNTVKKSIRVLDLGTGAGFPGIPLKIAFPQWNILLMDSLNKRILFLQDVINELGLSNISAVHGRAEEMARKIEYRESFDLCVSRAVANLSSLSEYCLPFVRLGGCFVSYKSGDIDEELNRSGRAIKLLGGAKGDVIKFQVPDTELNRSLVAIKKIKMTPKAYPRKAGIPSRDPLG